FFYSVRFSKISFLHRFACLIILPQLGGLCKLFFQALFYQLRSPLAPVYISKYPPSMSNTFFTFFIFFIKQKKDDRFESIIVHLVVFLVITKTIQAMPFPRYTTPIDLNHFDT
ncbi:hypothetical protein B5G15_06510, partial [Faecalitalea cylindroides]